MESVVVGEGDERGGGIERLVVYYSMYYDAIFSGSQGIAEWISAVNTIY